jgi:hypothetical protein
MSGTVINSSTGETTQVGQVTSVTSEGVETTTDTTVRTLTPDDQKSAQELAKEYEGKPIPSGKAKEEERAKEEPAKEEPKEKEEPKAKEEPKKEEPKDGEDPFKEAKAADPKWGQTPAADDDPRLAPYSDELVKSGKLSDDSVKKAAAQFGVPEAFVRNYVDGVVANSAAQETPEQREAAVSITEAFGGAKSYGEFQAWAAEGVKAEDMAAYNKALFDNPRAAVAMAKGFYASYKAAGQVPGRDITSGGVQSPQANVAVKPFASMAEQKAAQGDPRYANDPAFRSEVEKRIGVSKYFY